MPVVGRFPDGREYGYRLRNAFSGDIICDRSFETREEMERGLAEDLASDVIVGNILDSLADDRKK